MFSEIKALTIGITLFLATTSAVPTISSATKSSINERDTSWNVGQKVVTSSGTITGHAAPIAPFVSEYLGIPYGQSTAGSNRFSVPQAFTGTATISGANFVCLDLSLLHAYKGTDTKAGTVSSKI
jgi:hypothetical protein